MNLSIGDFPEWRASCPCENQSRRMVGVVGSKVAQEKGVNGSGFVGHAGAWHGQLLGPKSFAEANSTVPSSPSSCFSVDTDPFFWKQSFSVFLQEPCVLVTFILSRLSILQQASPHAHAQDTKNLLSNLSTSDIWGWLIVVGGCLVEQHHSIFCNILYHLLNGNSILQMSPLKYLQTLPNVSGWQNHPS